MRLRSALSTSVFFAVHLLGATGAFAQEAASAVTPATPLASGEAEVNRGIAAYEEADFDGALQAFEHAETLNLDRAQVVRVLSHRVLLAQATGDTATLETQALRLVTLDPAALADEASPDLTRALERARSRADGIVRLRVESEVVAGHVEVRARVEGDVAGLVREVRLRAGRSPTALSTGEHGVVQLEGASLEGIVLIAECIGPGNAVLAQEGSEAEPASLGAMTARNILQAPVTQASDDTLLHVGLVAGGAVAVIAAVVITVLVVDANAPRSQLSGPVVEW